MTNKDKRRSLDVWNTVPWLAARRIGGSHPRMSEGAGQAQHHSAHAAPGEQDPTPPGAELDAGIVPAEDPEAPAAARAGHCESQ